MTVRSGNRLVISGMNGPENVSFATVVMMVGTSNSLAALASTWTLLKATRRSCDCTGIHRSLPGLPFDLS
jgi:hypothetical protein